jgi:pimeloyl-ACP methyl ester carboxylesterase
MLQPLFALFTTIVTIYLVGCVTLFVAQRSMIYYPQRSFINSPVNTLKLPVADAELQVTVRLHHSPNAVIYFGGNAEDVSLNLPIFSAAFPEHALYLLHYRGYGDSSGTPSEQAIQQDALTLFDKVQAEHPNIVVIGRSLGSGVAVRLASLRPASRLLLITPFDSLQAVAAYHFPYLPVRWLLQDKYESWRYAAQITVPTLIVAADHDEVIPLANTKMLYSHFNSKIAVFKVLAETSHNTISDSPEYLPLLQEFVYGAAGK